MTQKKGTPCRKPRNSGGSPSGVSEPPMLATRKMKKTIRCTLLRRQSLARSRGRIRTMAAPVVPISEARKVPISSRTRLTTGRAAQGAAHVDAAGDGEQAPQQDDEGDVVHQVDVQDLLQRLARDSRSGRGRRRAGPRRPRPWGSGGARSAAPPGDPGRWKAGCPRRGSTVHRGSRPTGLTAWLSPWPSPCCWPWAASAAWPAVAAVSWLPWSWAAAGSAPAPRDHRNAVPSNAHRMSADRPRCRGNRVMGGLHAAWGECSRLVRTRR